MKKTKNLRTICLSIVAMALIITLSVGISLAYFTTRTSAKGGVTINFEFPETIIEEDVDVNGNSGYKKIVLKNTGNVDCYVRTKAYAGKTRTLTYSESASDSNTQSISGWERPQEEDGYYEYNSILAPEAETTPIYVHFSIGENDTNFNVIVIQECTPVLHGNDGEPLPAKWDTKTNDPITFVGTVSVSDN